MEAESITVDGVEYKVNILYPSRELSYELSEGINVGVSINDREISDVRGTRYSYVMQAEPRAGYQDEFDALFWTLSAPVPSHRFVMPFAQGTLEFDAKTAVGRIVDNGVVAGLRKWTGMRISITPIEPQRRP